MITRPLPWRGFNLFKGCATVAAIDLRDGRELWRTGRGPGSGEPADTADVVATGAGLAVLRDEGDAESHMGARGPPPPR